MATQCYRAQAGDDREAKEENNQLLPWRMRCPRGGPQAVTPQLPTAAAVLPPSNLTHLEPSGFH